MTSSPATKSVEDLRSRISGEALVEGDSGYEDSRHIWNGMIERRPAVVVQPRDTADVVEAVNYARANNQAISVKGGGHNVAGNSVGDGGMAIDFAKMRLVTVDASRKTATVQPGCLLGDMDRATQAHGLATPGGMISHTGVAGLTLGGGFGWLSRRHGLTIDNLVSVELVTAAGEVVVASKEKSPDLFWGVRGGGGNFGVVTSFEFRLHDVGPEVFAGVIIKPLGAAREYLQFHREYVRSLPREMTVWCVFRKAPPLPFLESRFHGDDVLALLIVHTGDPAEAERLVKPLRDCGETLGEHTGMTAYADWQSSFDGLQGHGLRNYWKSHNLNGLDDNLVDAILEFAPRMPSEHCEIFIPHLEGAIDDVAGDDTAYAHRKTPFVLNIHTRWEHAAGDESALAWVNELFARTAASSAGSAYVNFMSDEGQNRVRDAYSPKSWERLVALKRRYDPDNLFRLNQNIRP